ncbi:12 kDa heat shock protein [Lachnellula arida]|uniref:12 kDa heat shock protein n=2 Tax=Lachnellula TaxID=47830 RepID=A0A8T9B135_9HELO|nr:12 kDa heat shock protein [Lachnellula arida]TVY88988.1 12 kDa heat shock protein [Lachnellula willkommii]
MSDNMRKGLGEQVGEKVTPQSQKSNTQVASEKASGLGDKVAGAVQPNDDKSATQKAGDSTRSGANEGGSYLDSAKDSLSSAADTVTGKTKETTNS